MQIADQTVASFHYTLTRPDGATIESSRADSGGEPVTYLHGSGNIIPGLEKALLGKAAGDRVQVTVTPAEGYGERRDDMIQRIPAKYLGGSAKLKPGMQVPLKLEHGTQLVTVLKVGKFSVDIDANHPLAGETLCFDIEVLAVRAALPVEIEHGHAHGADGHAHHH
ncbi:MAG: FKBP-type peptidyl-prolyl cis-trans isomerase [Pseudomonadota bacterium]